MFPVGGEGGSLGLHNSLNNKFFLHQNPVIESELCSPNERMPEKQQNKGKNEDFPEIKSIDTTKIINIS